MKTNTSRNMTAALALALAVGLSACGAADDTGEGVTPTAVESTEETTTGSASADDTATDDTATDDTADDATSEDDQTSSEPAAAGDLTAVALLAIETAEAEAGGTAYEIDDQDDDGTWEVDVAVDDGSVEVTVSEDGTTVVGTEDDDLDAEDRAALDAASITLAEAIQVAIDEVGGVVDDAELEEEDGSYRWEVSVDGTDAGDDDVEVNVSVDGEVLSVGR